jgi:cytochrome c oxidase subunit 2
MTTLIIIASIVLLVVVILQISRLTDLYARIRGEEEVEVRLNRNQGRAFILFMVGFLALTIVSAYLWKNYMLGYGPHKAASAHGGTLDSMFNTTLALTGIVFLLTHIALFYFSWRYKKTRTSKATHWSAVPAVVMTYLVIKGLIAWNTVMADVEPGEDHIEIEATGYQFAWHLRYPGADGVLGPRNYKLISTENPLGQDWTDQGNHDDIHPDELWLPVNKKVRVRITARDVLHNFYLPHFRVKMDAVPGLPTYFVFTPSKTTEEYREELSHYPEYNKPADPSDPESKMLWETFNYELACAELCGSGHYSMRRIVRIVSEDEYNAWLAKQQSYYMSQIRGKASDPNLGKLLPIEIRQNREALNLAVDRAMVDTGIPMTDEEKAALRTIRLDAVQFETASNNLTSESMHQLDDLVSVMNKYSGMRIELGGHTDSTGDPAANRDLSLARAESVKAYLVGKGIDAGRIATAGYGSTRPVDTNDTEEGRQNNRRTEFRIIAQ